MPTIPMHPVTPCSDSWSSQSQFDKDRHNWLWDAGKYTDQSWGQRFLQDFNDNPEADNTLSSIHEAGASTGGVGGFRSPRHAPVQKKPTSQTGVNSTSKQSLASNNTNSNAAVSNTASKLDWSRVNSRTGETATDHVNLHGKDNLNKPDHGVFSNDPIQTTNNAWKNKGSIQPERQANGNDSYLIPYPNAGRSGGSRGNGATLNNVRIITVGGTNKVVTSFPVQ